MNPARAIALLCLGIFPLAGCKDRDTAAAPQTPLEQAQQPAQTPSPAPAPAAQSSPEPFSLQTTPSLQPLAPGGQSPQQPDDSSFSLRMPALPAIAPAITTSGPSAIPLTTSGTSDATPSPAPAQQTRPQPTPTPSPTPSSQSGRGSTLLDVLEAVLNPSATPPLNAGAPVDSVAPVLEIIAADNSGTLYKTDSPQTCTQVAQEGRCPLPFAPLASNIQYVNYTGADGHGIQLVRFEAPHDFCTSFATRWLTKYNRGRGIAAPGVKTSVTPLKLDTALTARLAKDASDTIPAPARVTWFDTDKIQHGVILGGPDPRPPGNPIFLIDADRHILYFWFAN